MMNFQPKLAFFNLGPWEIYSIM